MPKVLWKTATTLESLTQAPRTVRAEFVAPSPQKAASLAIRGARRAFRGTQYVSMVILLEKLGRVAASPDPIPTGPSGETVVPSEPLA